MDNRYYNYNCPPLMNDGRFINNYVRSSVFDQYIRNTNNINNSNEYRHFLQNNGYQIINNMKSYLRENNTCYVEGKCLPMNEHITPNTNNENIQKYWYEDLLDEEPPQLDFMMHKNQNDDQILSHLQPTYYNDGNYTTCNK
jgi:hypothetical protein